jgi:hypothetical protein
MPTIPWRALGRTLLQLLLAAPLLALLPWALMMGVGTLVFLFTGEARELSKTVFYGFGWLGLLGLLASILVPVARLRRRAWARRLVTGLLGCGFLAAMSPISSGQMRFWGREGLWAAWLLGGPMAVAAWNLWRLHGPLSAAMPVKHLPGPEAP